jgi:hypothetical protein
MARCEILDAIKLKVGAGDTAAVDWAGTISP